MLMGIAAVALFITLLLLKLGIGDTEAQNWSWWVVAAPLLVYGVVYLLGSVIGVLVALSFKD